MFSNYARSLDPNNIAYTVAELTANNTETPYPSAAINSPPGVRNYQIHCFILRQILSLETSLKDCEELRLVENRGTVRCNSEKRNTDSEIHIRAQSTTPPTQPQAPITRIISSAYKAWSLTRWTGSGSWIPVVQRCRMEQTYTLASVGPSSLVSISPTIPSSRPLCSHRMWCTLTATSTIFASTCALV